METKFFLDTNVIADMYFRRNASALALKKLIKKEKVPCYSSTQVLLEFFNLLKERKFLKKEIDKDTDLGTIIRNRANKELTMLQRYNVSLEFENFITDYSFIDFQELDTEGWNLVLDGIAKSNIPYDDMPHVYIAWSNSCTHFITRDTFLIRTGKEFRDFLFEGLKDGKWEKENKDRLAYFIQPVQILKLFKRGLYKT